MPRPQGVCQKYTLPRGSEPLKFYSPRLIDTICSMEKRNKYFRVHMPLHVLSPRPQKKVQYFQSSGPLVASRQRRGNSTRTQLQGVKFVGLPCLWGVSAVWCQLCWPDLKGSPRKLCGGVAESRRTTRGMPLEALRFENLALFFGLGATKRALAFRPSNYDFACPWLLECLWASASIT